MNKLDVFLDFFEKHNKDKKLAEFLNEVIVDLDGESEYINHIELESLQHQIRYKKRMEMINKNARMIKSSNRLLKQFRRLTNG